MTAQTTFNERHVTPIEYADGNYIVVGSNYTDDEARRIIHEYMREHNHDSDTLPESIETVNFSESTDDKGNAQYIVSGGGELIGKGVLL